jgi:hypothetical protein
MPEDQAGEIIKSRTWRGWRILVPLALILAALGLGAWNAHWRTWNGLDQLPEQWDEAHFISMSIRLNDKMHHDPADVYDYFVHASPNQGPFVPLAASLLYYISPRTVQTALNFNTFCIAVLLLSVYFLGARRSVLTGVIAAVTIACMMPVLQYMRLFRTELPLAAWVALVMLCLHGSERFKWFPPTLAAGALCGVAMLTNPIALIFLLAPVIYALIHGLADSKLSGLRVLNFLVGLFAAFAIFSVWYLPNQGAIHDFLFGYGFGAEGAAYRGTHPNLLFYPWMLFRDLGWPIFLAVFIVVIFAVVSRLAAKREGVTNRRKLDLWLVATWVIAAYVLLNIPSDQQMQFLLPLLPGAAILLAVLITSIKWNWALAGVTVLLLLACGCGLYAAFSQPLMQIREVDVTKNRDWRMKDIARAIAEDARGKPASVAFLANHALFTAKGFDLAALLDGHNFKVNYLGEEITPQTIGVQLEQSNYLVLKTGKQMEEGAKHLDVPVETAKKIAQAMQYTELEQFTLPDGSQALLFKRK